MLTLEGLNTVARHVVRTYVRRGPTDVETTYSWRDHLPNVIKAQLAPEFYLGHRDAMDSRTAATRAGEFLTYTIEAMAGRSDFTIDMRPALSRIEQLLATERSPSVREPMLAVYLLWHRLLPPEVHQPNPETTIEAAVDELQCAGLYSFAVAVLLDLEPPWDVDEWCELAEQRYEELHSRRPVEFPARFDSALWLRLCEVLQVEGAQCAARAALSRAVECSPGNQELLSLEREMEAGAAITMDVRTFLIDPLPQKDERSEDNNGGGEATSQHGGQD